MEVQWAGLHGGGFHLLLSLTVPVPEKAPGLSVWTNVGAHWAGWSREGLEPGGQRASWGLCSAAPDEPS